MLWSGGAACAGKLKCVSISKFSTSGEKLAPPLLWGSFKIGAVAENGAAQMIGG